MLYSFLSSSLKSKCAMWIPILSKTFIISVWEISADFIRISFSLALMGNNKVAKNNVRNKCFIILGY